MKTTTQPAHTAGPWFASIHKGSADERAFAVIRGVDSIAGLRHTGDYTEETFAANAHLIASAPDLFAACERAAAYIAAMMGLEGAARKPAEAGVVVHQALLEALVRARGGQLAVDRPPKRRGRS